MRIDEAADGRIKVALSRRNLKTLLAKLDGYPPESACTIYYSAKGKVLVVKAEEDAEHYANPERDLPVPGVMHPATEEAIRVGR